MTRSAILTAITALVATVPALAGAVAPYMAPSANALLKRAIAMPAPGALVILTGGDRNDPANGTDVLGCGSVATERAAILLLCPFSATSDLGADSALDLLEAVETALATTPGAPIMLAGTTELRATGWQLLPDDTLPGRLALILECEIRNPSY
jgi:hypothetical protein